MKKIIILSLLAVMSLVLAGCAVQQPEGLPPPADSDAALVGQGFATGSYSRSYQFYNQFYDLPNYDDTAINTYVVQNGNWFSTNSLRAGGSAIIGEVTVTALPKRGGAGSAANIKLETACPTVYEIEFDDSGNYVIYNSANRVAPLDYFRVLRGRRPPLRQIPGTDDAIQIHSHHYTRVYESGVSWFTLFCDAGPRVPEAPSGLRTTVCGNSQTEGNEVCDDGNTITEDSCPYGQRTSCTACNADCTQSLTNLPLTYCGDRISDQLHGLAQGKEACDDGNTVTEQICPYGQRSCTACNADCTQSLTNLLVSYCGDGALSPTLEEACDDGNTINGDGCNSQCQRETSVCGNGVREESEACDDGSSNGNTACMYGEQTCSVCGANCQAQRQLTGPYCGDGVLQSREICDGSVFRGNLNSCSSALGVNAVGSVKCIDCKTIDASQCQFTVLKS